jgi:hypothetical protein
MNMNFQVLHEKALKTAQNYLKAESDLISILQEIDHCRAYREFGFKSLFEYATQSLKLSESVSFNLITIARKSREVPQLQAMIQNQEITVSNARMVASVLTPENQERWLPVAATFSKRELEKEIAKEFPETKVQESARYVSEKRIELKLGISEELHEMLKRTQDLVSTQMGEAANFEETLKTVLEFYIEKKDPHRKAERAAQSSPVPGQVSYNRYGTSKPSNPRIIPAKLQHAIRLREGSQCAYRSIHGERCHEKRWLDFHHLKPISQGGQTTLENLTLLCRGHHQLIHH